MNKIILAGRLTRDPELKAGGSGTEYCNFTVACDRMPDKDGNKKADFLPCTAFQKTAAFVSKYFKKGNGIVLEGHLQSNSYEKNGEKRTGYEIAVERVEFPQGKSDGSGNTGSTASAPAFTDLSPANEEDLPF